MLDPGGCPVHFYTILCGNSNDTASRPRSRIARLLGFLTATPAEVVSAGVDNNSSLEVIGQ
jgi:hypothetical protein